MFLISIANASEKVVGDKKPICKNKFATIVAESLRTMKSL